MVIDESQVYAKQKSRSTILMRFCIVLMAELSEFNYTVFSSELYFLI